MKKLFFLSLILISSTVYGQFKNKQEAPVDIKSGIINSNPSSFFLGFINPNNFSMNHSFSMSYSAFSGNSIALGVYTNSIFYKFNDQLNIQVDASLVNSPYNSFGQAYSDQINGIYLSRAQLNYRPSDNMHFSIQFRNSPVGYYSPFGYYGYSRYNNSVFLEKSSDGN